MVYPVEARAPISLAMRCFRADLVSGGHPCSLDDPGPNTFTLGPRSGVEECLP
jgi:hypothetical protein